MPKDVPPLTQEIIDGLETETNQNLHEIAYPRAETSVQKSILTRFRRNRYMTPDQRKVIIAMLRRQFKYQQAQHQAEELNRGSQ